MENIKLILTIALFSASSTIFSQQKQIGISSTYWEVCNDTLYISGYGNMPDFYDASATPWYKIRTQLRYLEIENGIMRIGNTAFAYCNHFIKVTFPYSLTSIGIGAFSNCNRLTEITISELIDTIEYNAFYMCTDLSIVNFNAIHCNYMGNSNSVFSNCSSLNIGANVQKIPDYAFRGCTTITVLTMGDSVRYIGNYAFSWCTGLTGSLILPNNLDSIGDYAFEFCKGLTSVTMSESVSHIGNSAFDVCSGLISVNLSQSLKCINDYVFSACINLKTINIPDSVTYIGDGAFNGCGFTSINIPLFVKRINRSVFAHCGNLTTINIPDSVTYIGHSAFKECYNLTFITIPPLVDTIESYAFSGCDNLKTITIPKAVKSIGFSAFYCRDLTKIITESLIPPIIDYNTFNNVSHSIPVFVPCGSKIAYQSVLEWNNFHNIIERNTYLVTLHSIDLAMGAISYLQSPCKSDTIIFQAIASPVHCFLKWTDGNTDNPRIHVLTQDTSFTAIFAGTGFCDVGIEQNTDTFRAKIYPNPVKNTIRIQTSSKIEQIIIYDVNGRLLKQLSNPLEEINISDLANGIYFVKIFTQESIITRKIIKE